MQITTQQYGFSQSQKGCGYPFSHAIHVCSEEKQVEKIFISHCLTIVLKELLSHFSPFNCCLSVVL